MLSIITTRSCTIRAPQEAPFGNQGSQTRYSLSSLGGGYSKLENSEGASAEIPNRWTEENPWVRMSVIRQVTAGEVGRGRNVPSRVNYPGDY